MHNTVRYLVLKKRYKILPMACLYMFALLICLTRILQHAYSFPCYEGSTISFFNLVANFLSICLGINQLVVVVDLVVTIQLYKLELVAQSPLEVEYA